MSLSGGSQMLNISKRTRRLAALRSVAAVILSIFASIGMTLSAVYSIAAYSEGWLLHSVMAAMIAMLSLLLVMRGARIFNQPLEELELAWRRKQAGKAKHLTLQDLANSEEGDSALRSKEGNELEQMQDSEALAELADVNPLEVELNPEELPINNLQTLAEESLAVKDMSLTQQNKNAVREDLHQPIIESKHLHADSRIAQESQTLQAALANSLQQDVTRKIDFLSQTLSATGHNADPYMPLNFVGVANARAERKIPQGAEKATQQNKIESTQAKIMQTTKVQTTSVTSTTAGAVNVSLHLPVASGTKSLQFVDILLNMVTKVVSGIKSVFNNLTSSPRAIATLTASSPPPKQNIVQTHGPS